ncbi:MAG: hypothetical protein Q7S86_01775 [bacterium]|nr:hypothetical protein [bacterium]
MELLRKYRTLVEMVRQDHIAKKALGKGHNSYHAHSVANLGLLIAPDPDTAELTWVSGITHNTDHLFGEEAVPHHMERYLSETNLSPQKRDTIIEAVVNHSAHKSKYNDDDSLVKRALMDADKVDCLGANVIIRATQFIRDITDYDPRYVLLRDPSASYRNPKSIVRDIQGCLEWIDEEGWFRFPKALEMARARAVFLRTFLETLTSQLRESSMLCPEFPETLAIN